MERRTFLASVAALPLLAAAKAPTVLAPPVRPAMDALRSVRRAFVEIGPGDGYWVRAMHAHGLTAKGFDIAPAGPDVIRGDHADAAAYANAETAMLAVWPPDGWEVRRWIAVRPWPVVALVGADGRFDPGDTLQGYELVKRLELPPGRKAANALAVYRRV